MRKLGALYVNEMTKMTRKISILVLAAIMAVVTVGMGALVKITQVNNRQYILYSGAASTREELEESIREAQEQIQDCQSQLENQALGEEERRNLQMQLNDLQVTAERDRLALKYNLAGENPNSYYTAALQDLAVYRQKTAGLESTPSQQLTAEQRSDQEICDLLVKSLEQDSFRLYTDAKIKMIEADDTLSEEEKQIEIDCSELLYQAEPTGQTAGGGGSAYDRAASRIGQYRLSLLNNANLVEDGGKEPLTNQKRAKLEDALAVLTYRLQNGQLPADYESYSYSEMATFAMMSMGVLVLGLLIIILAGSAVSSEMSTGSIKSLIIAPVKRWKILTAKILALLTVSVLGLALWFLTWLVTSGLLFGFGGVDYVFALGGSVCTLPYYLYMAARLLTNLIPLSIYLLLALMLSVVTRNTAAAVGVGMAVTFGGEIVTTVLAQLSAGEWMKFVPFYHLSLESKFFPFGSLEQLLSGYGGDMSMLGMSIPRIANTSLVFSLIYLAALALCMALTAYDSFIRRDIK